MEDQVSLTGNFRNGALLSCLWSFNGTPGVYDDTIKIRGTKGEIELSTFQPTPLKVVTIAENEEAPVLREIDFAPTGARSIATDSINMQLLSWKDWRR